MAGYAMAPLNAPLPTAWNFPFQPAAGNQTSILIFESLVGESVAATRQNAGSAEKSPASPPASVLKVPGWTNSATVIAAWGSAILARSPHAVAVATNASATSIRTSLGEDSTPGRRRRYGRIARAVCTACPRSRSPAEAASVQANTSSRPCLATRGTSLDTAVLALAMETAGD